MHIYYLIFDLAFCYSGAIFHKRFTHTPKEMQILHLCFFQVCALLNVKFDVCGNFLQIEGVHMAASVMLCWRIMHANKYAQSCAVCRMKVN